MRIFKFVGNRESKKFQLIFLYQFLFSLKKLFSESRDTGEQVDLSENGGYFKKK